MLNAPDKAFAEFRRMMIWIALAGIVMVIGALRYLSLYEPLRLHMVIATAAFLGPARLRPLRGRLLRGHDRDVTDATRRKDDSE